LAADNSTPENIATAVTEVSEAMSTLVREELELAKAEVSAKVNSILRGTAAVAAGAVFGVFAIIFALETIAWALNAIFVSGAGDLWLGFLIVFIILLLLTGAAALFAWRKLRVGAPTPNMAIDEAKKIRETVTSNAQDGN
jgi:Putative Actinobacterial Holin-X, holin superfamily III